MAESEETRVTDAEVEAAAKALAVERGDTCGHCTSN